MKKSNDTESLGGRFGEMSQISTPRLTPLKFLDRTRNQLISQDDISMLEAKIREMDDQITNAKKKN